MFHIKFVSIIYNKQNIISNSLGTIFQPSWELKINNRIKLIKDI